MLFKDVMVDEGLKKQLVMLADENRISHAQLFLGKKGTHSFALAVAFAQYISCSDRHDGDSCGKCPSCLMFEKLQHPDLHLIFPNCTTKEVKNEPDSKQFMSQFRDFVFAHNYHIDFDDWVKEMQSENKQISINIRDCSSIIQQNNIRSYQGGYKIYILWKAEKLHYTAAPKLLKTLEEPENKTLFLLLAESSDQILPTILSRTQLVKIPPLKENVIRQHLVNDEHIDEKVAADFAAISEGSYTKALGLIKKQDELHHLLKQYDNLLKSLNAYVTNADLTAMNYLEIQNMFGEIIKEGREKQKQFINYLSRMFRNELLLHQKSEHLVKAMAAEHEILERYKILFTVKNAAPLLNECNRALYHIERNVSAKLIFTDLYFKIAAAFAKR